MLVIRIELWSAITHKTTDIGCMSICNIGGAHNKGNYEAEIHKNFEDLKKRKTPKKMVYTDNFPRKTLNAWDLLFRLLLESYGKRNKTVVKKWLLRQRGKIK